MRAPGGSPGSDAIGGYFGLELARGRGSFHADAVALNSGRNALAYILRGRRDCRRVLIPDYVCDALLTPLQRLGIAWECYEIGTDLRPREPLALHAGDVLLAVDYFGLLDDAVLELAARYGQSVVIDACQAFFFRPPPGMDVFYSARKFFGVPDGGYARCAGYADMDLEPDTSHDRCAALLKRHDCGAEAGYADFTAAEQELAGRPLRGMSRLARRILDGVDYKAASAARRRNFRFLHGCLRGVNRLQLSLGRTAVPLVYPLWTDDGERIRRELASRRIFTAQYWPGVSGRVPRDSTAAVLARDLVALPVDQRYGTGEMEQILSALADLGYSLP